MMKLILCLGILLMARLSSAQTGTVKGFVQDASNNAFLAKASVSISTATDSLLVASSITSDSGYFEIRFLDSGAYYLTISYEGYELYKKLFSILGETGIANLDTLKIEKKFKTLSEVVVINKTPIKIKADTIAYNADAFKTRPNATAEDLLKKLPGIQVERSGAVLAYGEEVQKVYVDGKEYFGTELQMATKNFTADMIDEVQVFDDQSEGAKFSGVNDGSRTKAINLKLKKGKKKGVSGRIHAGYGSKNRYDAGIRTNYFKGASRLSFIGSANNINRAGSGSSDLLMEGRNGGGLETASSLALNYNDTWGSIIDISGSYSFSRKNLTNQLESARETILPNATLFTSRQTDNNNTYYNHRLNEKIVFTIDSLNSIIYTTALTSQTSRSSLVSTFMDSVQDPASSYTRSNTRTISNIKRGGYNWYNNMIWRKKFKRRGRTFSANFLGVVRSNNKDGSNIINAEFYNENSHSYVKRTSDLKTYDKNDVWNYALTLSYTEPISRTSVMEFNYSNNSSTTSSDRTAYSFNNRTKQYDELNDSLTNNFNQVTKFNRVGANFRDVKKKYNYQIGLSLQQSVLLNDNISNKTGFSQHYTNVIPTASINYQLGKNKSFRMAYRGRNNQPSILQLQDVADISNYPYIRRGNPALRQEFAHNLTIAYNFFNTSTFRNVFASIVYNNTQNKIIYGLHFKDGEQIFTPINVNGAYSINGSFGYSIPIDRMNGGNFSTTTRIGFSQNPGLVNNVENFGKNLQLSEQINFSLNLKQSLDLNLNAGVSFNSVNQTIHQAQKSFYFTHNYSLDLAYTFSNEYILSTTADYIAYPGNDADVGSYSLVWNASLAKRFLKNKRGELTFSIYNILNQTDNPVRNIYDNVVEYSRSQVQKRFVLLTFMYHLKGTAVKM